MPRCYFLPGKGEIRSSAGRHPVGRQSLNLREGCASRRSVRSDEGARVSVTNGSLHNVVVLKVGGSVLAGTKAFRKVALFLKHRREAAPDEKLAVVVSAQKGTTDALERRARRIAHSPAVRTTRPLVVDGRIALGGAAVAVLARGRRRLCRLER